MYVCMYVCTTTSRSTMHSSSSTSMYVLHTTKFLVCM